MDTKTKAGLSAWQLTMLALGTVVGGSFFLGSSIAIRAAGPAIFLAFILGGVLVYFILSALSEMAVANPRPGSFQAYSQEAFGPWLGFVVGWVYWTGLVLAMSSEATAASVFIQAWIPRVSLPALATIIVAGVTLLNLLGARTLSHLESSLAAVKLAALAGFAGLALALIIGIFPGKAPVGLGALALEPVFPGGIRGVAGSMLIVLFSYAGFEIIGLASSEARDPHKTIPRAIIYTVIVLIGLYCSVIAVLLPLVPTAGLSQEVSPLVAALTSGGLSRAAGSINVIMITAIISTMLAATFGLGRMVRSLADAGHAPAFLVDKGDVPLRGILFSGAAMLASVSLGYLLPRQIYLFLVSSGGFSLLFVYAIILITHNKHRRIYGCPPKGHCQLAGFPYTSWFAIAGLVAVIATMPLIPGQGSGLYVGLLLTGFYLMVYTIFKSNPRRLFSRGLALAKPLPPNLLNTKEHPNQINKEPGRK
ncbi:amino acid permease [Pelotomaculum propionicicum]|uniref:amino acid permease n=1 Tax=Pelotomaculum propionicicum TaxID=258475 RepID=UPI003B7D017A